MFLGVSARIGLGKLPVLTTAALIRPYLFRVCPSRVFPSQVTYVAWYTRQLKSWLVTHSDCHA